MSIIRSYWAKQLGNIKKGISLRVDSVSIMKKKQCEICGLKAHVSPGVLRTYSVTIAPWPDSKCPSYKEVCQFCRSVLSRDQFPNKRVGKYK